MVARKYQLFKTRNSPKHSTWNCLKKAIVILKPKSFEIQFCKSVWVWSRSNNVILVRWLIILVRCKSKPLLIIVDHVGKWWLISDLRRDSRRKTKWSTKVEGIVSTILLQKLVMQDCMLQRWQRRREMWDISRIATRSQREAKERRSYKTNFQN